MKMKFGIDIAILAAALLILTGCTTAIEECHNRLNPHEPLRKHKD